ncbi:MAG: diacylglycerol/polyprenol kinase family protein [Thermoanaerobaculia bacterium]
MTAIATPPPIDVVLTPPPTRRITGDMIARKLFHINGGSLTWFIRFLKPTTIVGFTLFLLILNRFIMPRLANGRTFWHWERFWRESERRKGTPSGILVYCISIFVLSIVFFEAKWMLAAIWGVLAYGDGMAELAGRGLGGPKLPWNAKKSWTGSGAFVLFGGITASALIAWTLHGSFLAAVPLGFALAAVCALAESLPIPIDDNITVPAAGAIALPLLAMVPWLSPG